MAKTVYVTLEIKEDPPVRVDPVIRGDKKMKWRQHDDSVEFDFVDLTGLPDSFKKTKKTKRKIDFKDDMDPGDYAYTITVEYKGVRYSTTPSKLSAADRKPVIRN
jgi:hypothetical protein